MPARQHQDRWLDLLQAGGILALSAGLVLLVVVGLTEGIGKAGTWASVLGTSLAIIGGIVALVTSQRQRRDATERRITELYTNAAEQLGSDHAPVRLAGLYALERLAHSTFEHRQTIVDVICAYLRMPYTPPPETPQAGAARYRGPRPRRRRQSLFNDRRSRSEAPPTDRHEQSRQERQVRLTALDILSHNLRRPHEFRPRRWWNPWSSWGVYREPPWPGIRLNLNGALLLDVDLRNCRIAKADFTGAQFTGPAYFTGAQFTGPAYFTGAQFTGPAKFEDAQFTDVAHFEGAQFTGPAYFTGAQFTGPAYFTGAQFTGPAYFTGAQFTGPAKFEDAQFTDVAHFEGAQFTGPAYFTGAQFTDLTLFEGAQIGLPAESDTGLPPGWTTRPAQPNKGEDPAARYLARSDDPASGNDG